MALSGLAVRQAKDTGKAYTLPDSDGLSLAVTAAGGRTWHFRCYWAGKQKPMSLGTYPAHERDPWGDPGYPNPAAEYDKIVTADIRSPRRNIEGFDDYAQVGSLADRLQARGYSVADVERLLGGNLLRVFGEVWV